MAKKVIYNGGTESYSGCSDSRNLVLGKIYEVISERQGDWQTDYTLKGVEGSYNSVWFDEIPSKNTYLATAHTEPEVGKIYACSRIDRINGVTDLVSVVTSRVESVTYTGNNIYYVNTKNSLYIVTIT